MCEWQLSAKNLMSQCISSVGSKESSAPVSSFLKMYFFSRDVLKQFMLLWSLGDNLCILNFCDVLFDWNLSAFFKN